MKSDAAVTYDALLLVSFGGPEKHEDVIPFLENVLRGRNVPRERMLEVAEHYDHFGGVSPINAQNRELIAALERELAAHGPHLPVYWGNRNWYPLLPDTLQRMADDGVRRALALVTSAYSSYSSCRQYLENIERAREQVGPRAPQVDKLRPFYNHPGFIEAAADRVKQALAELPQERRTAAAALIFTAHSIPLGMADHCEYQRQLEETCRLVGAAVGRSDGVLVYQSRSGRPEDPWLGPDICEYLRTLPAKGVRDTIVVPIGFMSDHMEVVYDLDTEARDVCSQVGLHMVRAATVGTHPRLIAALRELILERLDPSAPRRALGAYDPAADVCPAECCPAPSRGRRG